MTYSNRAKSDMLDVPGDMIADYGAVSEPVARAMAEGALAHSSAHLAVAVTGVAGPGGGTSMKPVGLVHLATAAVNGAIIHREERFIGLDRSGGQTGPDGCLERFVATRLARWSIEATGIQVGSLWPCG